MQSYQRRILSWSIQGYSQHQQRSRVSHLDRQISPDAPTKSNCSTVFDIRYDVTSLACCRLILSLRHHAYKQDPSLLATKRNITQFKSGVVKVRNPVELRFEVEEKGMPHYPEPSFQAHIALDTFKNIQRKNDDNESLNSDSVGQAAPVQRVFVVTETKTAVDERVPGEVEVKR